MRKRVDIWYARPDSMYGYEIDVPDELLTEDADEDDLHDWMLDNLPWGEAEPDDWNFV